MGYRKHDLGARGVSLHHQVADFVVWSDHGWGPQKTGAPKFYFEGVDIRVRSGHCPSTEGVGAALPP